MDRRKKASALVIIDMQNDFVLPGAPACVAGAQETIPRVREVLAWFRKKGLPVFHVVRQHRRDGSDVEITRLEQFAEREPFAVAGTKGCDIIHELQPLPHEYRVVKQRFSAFMHTELDFILRRLEVDHICICGTQYPVCIRATVFDGIAYGYQVTVLTDATSAQTAEITRANIRDIEDLGVACLTVEQFKEVYSRDSWE